MQDTFKWTRETINEFLDSFPDADLVQLAERMEQFKSSKSPKKEWEVVAFMCEGRVFRLRENYKEYAYELPAFTDGDSILGIAYGLEPKNNCAIHSVRRLSDDWTVSVKDRVKTVSGKIGTIQAINADGHILFEDITGLEHITTIQKLPQVILATVDVGEIRLLPETEFWYVDKEFFVSGSLVATENININKVKEVRPNYLFFSAEQAATDWITQNKPLLSLNDVKEAIGSNDVFGTLALRERLTALVKQKLNQ